MPVEGNKEDGNVKEDENRKEPLSFLHVAEQEKVRKLISQYQKIGEAEVGVQTDKRISKEVGVQKDGNEQPKCSCHDELLDKVTSLENKLEQLVSVIKNSNKQPDQECKIPEDIFNCTDPITCSFDSFDEESSTVLQTISEVASICSNNTLPGMTATIAEERTVNLRTASVISPSFSVISPSSVSAIQPSVYDELFKKSSSISNFAKNLVFELFEPEELKDSNCSGAHQKKSLERDPRMDLIKESIFKKFQVEDKTKAWSACRKAIDSAIRKLRFKA